MKIFNNSDIVLENDNIKIMFHSYVLISHVVKFSTHT